MRILHIIDSLNPDQGGTVECVRQIGTAVTALGHTVEVAVLRDLETDPWIKEFPLQAHALGPAIGFYGYNMRLIGWLEIHGCSFDAWIVNGLWQFQGLAASRVAKRSHVPYFVYSHGMLDPWSRRANPIKYLKKFFYWLLVERSILINAHRVVFTSIEESKLAEQFFPTSGWIPAVVGNGVAEPPACSAEDMQSFRNEFPRIGNRRVWLFLSRIHSKKGLENLLKAYSEIAAVDDPPCLVIAGTGEGTYVERLKTLSRQLRIDRHIVWTGPLYGIRKWAAFKSAELFVLASHQENFGIVIAEALAMGIPVCTTTAVNIWREVDEEGAGIVCDDSVTALSVALKKWSALSPNERAAFGSRARSCFERHFEIDSAARKLVSAIQDSIIPENI